MILLLALLQAAQPGAIAPAQEPAVRVTDFDPTTLSAAAERAFGKILELEEAKGTSIGILGSTPPNPLFHLWEEPDPVPALRALCRSAKPAGRFLSLAGLFCGASPIRVGG